MVKLYVLCEGKTEVRFCKEILKPRLEDGGVDITPIMFNKNGGFAGWPKLFVDIKLLFNTTETVYVTTLFDFYGIEKKHNMPGWSNLNLDKVGAKRFIETLEAEMKAAVNAVLPHDKQECFLPYIQMHEFEALLFSDLATLQSIYKPSNALNQEVFNDIEKIIKKNDNPELINSNPNSYPSYRIKKLITYYDKVLDGVKIANAIGLDSIKAKCPRFATWYGDIFRLGLRGKANN